MQVLNSPIPTSSLGQSMQEPLMLEKLERTDEAYKSLSVQPNASVSLPLERMAWLYVILHVCTP